MVLIKIPETKHYRRLRRIKMPEQWAVDWFRMVSDKYVYVPELPPTIPEGTTVERVWYNPDWQGWDLWIYHESFPEVEEGQIIPYLMEEPIMYTVRKIVLGDAQ